MPSDHPDLFYRFLAKACDLAIGLSLCFLVRPFGTVLGVIYLLVGDALVDGSSPFKWLVGLRTVDKFDGSPCNFKESVLRNLPFGLAGSLMLIPVLGVLLSGLVGTLFIAVESYFLYTDPEGSRLGDVLADTRVMHTEPRRALGAARDEVLPPSDDPDEA